MGTFLHWVNVASPGFHPDLFTLYGWLSASSSSRPCRNAGTDPSRGSILPRCRKITSFNGGNIVTTSNPAARTTSNCYLIGQVVNGSGRGRTTRRSTAAPTGTVATTPYVTPPKS